MLAVLLLALDATQSQQTALAVRAADHGILVVMVLEVKRVLLACGKSEPLVSSSLAFCAFIASQIYGLGARSESLAASERLALISSLELGFLRL